MSRLNDEDVLETLKFIMANIVKNWQRVKFTLPYEIDFATFSRENYVLSHKEKEDGYLVDVYLNPAFSYKYLKN